MLATDQQVSEFVKLFYDGTRLEYKKNELIVRPGEQPAGVFYIEEGLVKAYNISKYGEENLLIIRKSGDIFPLIWALTDAERDINYQALSSIILWRIGRDQYLEYLRSLNSSLAPLLDMVVNNYRMNSERILNLEYRTVRERVVSFLITMSSHFGEPIEQGILISAPLRHQDIASSINSSRETASREMAYLERKGLISTHQSLILIKDYEKLGSYL